MDLGIFESGASGTPPTAPASPSSGYPTNGDPGAPTPATVAGEFWFYQQQAEMTALLTAAGITPSTGDLTQVLQAIQFFAPILPFAALQYPTIDTSDNRLNVTSASASAGGTVSIPADVEAALGEEVTAGKTGRMRRMTTAAWTSADLDASSTYFLRAQISGGVWTPYVQKGTDADSVPAGLKGTPGGGSGGGFDSTVLDILLAKVVTGTAGSTPTVTKLANAAVLRTVSEIAAAFVRTLNWAALSGTTVTLNWARAPTIAAPVLSQVRAARLDQVAFGVDITTGSGTLQMQGIREASTASRYSRSLEYVYDDSVDTDGYGEIKWILEA